MSTRPLFVVGDVHGHRDRLVELLRDAGLVDPAERWCGADARLWLLGDLTDRGPDGLGAIDLAMRLEAEAGVGCLLGNHEVLLLAADRHPDVVVRGSVQTFREVWLVNGGNERDLAGLDDERRAWIARRPALAREDDWLVLHSDTDRYLELGGSVDEVNAAAGRVLASAEAGPLDLLLRQLGDRLALDDPARLERLLAVLGGERAVHGHTPIAVVLGVEPQLVTEPLVHGDGRLLNVDHCLFAGGPGFVTRLD